MQGTVSQETYLFITCASLIDFGLAGPSAVVWGSLACVAQGSDRPAPAPVPTPAPTSFFARLRRRGQTPATDHEALGPEVEAEQRRLESLEDRATQQCAVGLCKLACFAGKLTIAGTGCQAVM